MAQDTFFSTYGDDRLLIEGTVATIGERNGATFVGLKTSGSNKVECATKTRAPAIQAGDVVTVQADEPRADVSRQSGGMVIENCRIVESK
jgi:hypothetical protein